MWFCPSILLMGLLGYFTIVTNYFHLSRFRSKFPLYVHWLRGAGLCVCSAKFAWVCASCIWHDSCHFQGTCLIPQCCGFSRGNHLWYNLNTSNLYCWMTVTTYNFWILSPFSHGTFFQRFYLIVVKWKMESLLLGLLASRFMCMWGGFQWPSFHNPMWKSKIGVTMLSTERCTLTYQWSLAQNLGSIIRTSH